jgi:hypothetical protein
MISGLEEGFPFFCQHISWLARTIAVSHDSCIANNVLMKIITKCHEACVLADNVEIHSTNRN